MIKVGIIGWDKHLQYIASLVNEMEGFLLTGWLNDNSSNSNIPDKSKVVNYPSFEALYRYVDAVVMTYKSKETIETICNCLKHFKHVYVLNAQCLNYTEVSYILKIAEESNVMFYPEYGSLIPDMNEIPCKMIQDIQFIDITQTFSINEGICLDGRISLSLLRNICFVLGLVSANAKKISTNGWGFTEPGAGMLNARIDFDNGSSVNILLVNSLKTEQLDINIYGRSEILRIKSMDSSFKVTQELLTIGQLENYEKTLPSGCYLKTNLSEFIDSIYRVKGGLDSLANRHKSFKIAHTIQEKINHFVNAHVFFS